MTNQIIRAIPTVYRGITFRSRLEAKWAVMFDLLGWPWEYEPLDLNGYIPDFILQFHDPVLAEVKPAMSFEDCPQYTQKIARSGWDGEALIFGAALKLGPESFLGPQCCYYGQLIMPEELGWGPGELHSCTKCGAYSIYHTEHSYRCLVGGCYDGTAYLGCVDFDVIHSFWARATEIVRFAPEGKVAA